MRACNPCAIVALPSPRRPGYAVHSPFPGTWPTAPRSVPSGSPSYTYHPCPRRCQGQEPPRPSSDPLTAPFLACQPLPPWICRVCTDMYIRIQREYVCLQTYPRPSTSLVYNSTTAINHGTACILQAPVPGPCPSGSQPCPNHIPYAASTYISRTKHAILTSCQMDRDGPVHTSRHIRQTVRNDDFQDVAPRLEPLLGEWGLPSVDKCSSMSGDARPGPGRQGLLGKQISCCVASNLARQSIFSSSIPPGSETSCSFE